jgi:hypothetical protein
MCDVSGRGVSNSAELVSNRAGSHAADTYASTERVLLDDSAKLHSAGQAGHKN